MIFPKRNKIRIPGKGRGRSRGGSAREKGTAGGTPLQHIPGRGEKKPLKNPMLKISWGATSVTPLAANEPSLKVGTV